IALHFFYRSRYRTVPWAAMEFLLTSLEQTSRRQKLQELILLLLRVAVLVLLGLALARPVIRLASQTSGGQGDAVDAVFVIDTSASMAAKDGNLTRLAPAKPSALAAIEQLPPSSTVQVAAVSDTAVVLPERGPRNPGRLDQAREAIHNLKVTHRSTDLLPGVQKAVALLSEGERPNK